MHVFANPQHMPVEGIPSSYFIKFDFSRTGYSMIGKRTHVCLPEMALPRRPPPPSQTSRSDGALFNYLRRFQQQLLLLLATIVQRPIEPKGGPQLVVAYLLFAVVKPQLLIDDPGDFRTDAFDPIVVQDHDLSGGARCEKW